MKIVLSKGDVMGLICEKYDIETLSIVGEITPEKDDVYWEGNPDEEMMGREAAKEPEKKKEG